MRGDFPSGLHIINTAMEDIRSILPHITTTITIITSRIPHIITIHLTMGVTTDLRAKVLRPNGILSRCWWTLSFTAGPRRWSDTTGRSYRAIHTMSLQPRQIREKNCPAHFGNGWSPWSCQSPSSKYDNECYFAPRPTDTIFTRCLYVRPQFSKFRKANKVQARIVIAIDRSVGLTE